MPQLHQSTVRNRLLAWLAPEDFEWLAPALVPVTLPLRETLIAPYQPIEYAYFLETGVCSLISNTAESRIEIGLIGSEGMTGLPLILGTDRSPHLAIMQGGGSALRIEALALREILGWA